MFSSLVNCEKTCKKSSTPFDDKEESFLDEYAGGDGPNIDRLMQQNVHNKLPERQKSRSTSIFETKGMIEFRKPGPKFPIAQSFWERPCCLKIAYSGNLKQLENFNIQLIIYGENSLTKRNLLPEFDECVKEENSG